MPVAAQCSQCAGSGGGKPLPEPRFDHCLRERRIVGPEAIGVAIKPIKEHLGVADRPELLGYP